MMRTCGFMISSRASPCLNCTVRIFFLVTRAVTRTCEVVLGPDLARLRGRSSVIMESDIDVVFSKTVLFFRKVLTTYMERVITSCSFWLATNSSSSKHRLANGECIATDRIHKYIVFLYKFQLFPFFIKKLILFFIKTKSKNKQKSRRTT